MKAIDLNHLSEYFPWSAMYEALGYAMPYPEVIMTSDRAYALQTQVFGLLMMQSWASGNRAAYHIERAEATHEAYTLDYELELPTIDEAWQVVGITTEMLLAYMHTALIAYIQAKVLPEGTPYRAVSLSPGRCMFVAE